MENEKVMTPEEFAETMRKLVEQYSVWSFEYAYIYIGGEKLVEGKVTSWLNFEESDMIQVEIGGKTYLTHSSNVVLVNR